MKRIRFNYSDLLFFFFTLLIAISCGKGGAPTPPDSCSGITVIVSGTPTNPTVSGVTNGSINVSATGGGGFTFSINGGSFQSSGTFSGLAAGSYAIIAKNSNGCTGTATFNLVALNPCAGVVITVNASLVNPTLPGALNGTITASASGSTGFTYNINGGLFQSSGVFSNLGEGNYSIIAKDANGCTGTASFTLTAPNPCSGITITVNGTVLNPSTSGSSNGSILASASGSTGFTFRLNNGPFQSTGTFNNLAAGNYSITAKDLNGCTGSANFALSDPNPCSGVTITAGTNVSGNTPCGSASGMITVNPTGGTAPYTFSLNSGAFQSSAVFLNLSNGTFTIVAKDVNGCEGTANNVIVPNLPAGIKFTAVKLLIQNNCVSCHNPTTPNGGMDWTVDCNIVTFKDRIEARAVNANPSAMPPTGLLSASERQKITDWIIAGGRFTD